MNKEALIEALKEVGRVILMAVVPLVVVGLESGSLDFKVIFTAGLIAGLRFIDKYLHETAPKGTSGGLFNF